MELGLSEMRAEPLGMDDIIFYKKKMSESLRIKLELRPGLDRHQSVTLFALTEINS
jgi:hypothetical protein